MQKSKSRLYRGVSLAVLGSALSFSVAQADQTNFNIKSQSLRDALLVFSVQADLVVVVPEDIRAGEITRTLSGEMEADDGLKFLLEDTGLSYRRGKSGQFNIGKDPSYGYQEIAFATEADYQENFHVSEDDERADEIEDMQLEEIAVTGSRIARDSNLTSTSPITTIGQEAILLSGKTNVEDLVSEIPSLVGSSGSFDTLEGSSTGVNYLNLRNLGTKRTLVLVNGRRHVGADADGIPTVDTNTIPSGLIERVEVLTGGASSIYGADAVSGVVNFILKKNFDGISTRAQYGVSKYGDAQDKFISILAGTNFDDDRGNITVSYEFNKSDELLADDRDFASLGQLRWSNNEYRQDDDPDVFDYSLRGDHTWVWTAPDGRLDTDAGSFNAQGQPFNTGERVGSSAIGGDGTPFHAFRSQLMPEFESHNFNILGHYDVNDKISAFFEFKYSRTEASTLTDPTFTSYLTLSIDNPFLPQAVVDANLAESDDPYINIGRDDFEFRGNDANTREVTRFVIGFEGEINDWASYEISYNRGVTKSKSITDNERREDRYFAAIDAVLDPETGNIVCRSDIDPNSAPNIDEVVSAFRAEDYPATFNPGPNSGCVPFNVFESTFFDPNSNAAAIAFITDAGNDLISRGRYEQNVINGFVALDSSGIGFELPAGPISLVLGGEYRVEQVSNVEPDILTDPRALIWGGTRVSSSPPKLKTMDFFAETSIPLIRDGGPLLHQVTLDGAYRYSDYDIKGSTLGSTTAWSVGLSWSLAPEFTMRSSYAQSVRAPNLFELFEPSRPDNFGPSHPCDINRTQSANTAANCAIALAAIGLDPATFEDNDVAGRLGRSQGNVNLRPETANTFTLGAVFQPTAIDGLSITVDYFDISLEGGILSPNSSDIASQCFGADTLDNQFCELFDLEAGTGVITNLSVSPVNVSIVKTRGVDFSMNYITDLSYLTDANVGSFNFRLAGSKLLELTVQPTVDPIFENDVGEANTLLGNIAPEWVVNFDLTWRYEDLTVNYGINYHSKLLSGSFDNEDLILDLDLAENPYIPAQFQHSIRTSYQITDNFNGYAGINNLFDQKPFSPDRTLPVSPVGRFFYFGVQADF